MNKQNKKIIFWGTPEFAVPSLDTLNSLGIVSLVVSQPDRPAGRNKKLLPSPVKQYATDNSLDFLCPEKLDEQFVEDIKKYLPATFVVVAYGKIIAQEVLDLSEFPAINIHPSILPILRGPSPIQTAILKGFEDTGVSLIQLDEKMDHGPVLGQIEAKISDNDDYISLSSKLADLGAGLLKDNILAYLNQEITPLPQDDSQATFCKMLKKEDGHIDWTKTAKDIYNQIRAFSLWPNTYSRLSDLDIKIIKAQVVDNNLEPGQIFFDKNNIIVGCGQGSLKIIELQPSGKKVMSSQAFIQGYKDHLAKKFS